MAESTLSLPPPCHIKPRKCMDQIFRASRVFNYPLTTRATNHVIITLLTTVLASIPGPTEWWPGILCTRMRQIIRIFVNTAH